MSDWKPIYKYVVAPLTVGVTLLCLTLEYNSSSHIKPITWIRESILVPIWNGLNYPLPLWSVLVILIIFLIMRNINIKPTKANPNFDQYVADNIMDIDWTWRWYQRGNKWFFDDLVPFCPRCQTRLEPITSAYAIVPALGYECYNCHYQKTDNNGIDFIQKRVAQEIERRIKSNQYLEAINRHQ